MKTHTDSKMPPAQNQRAGNDAQQDYKKEKLAKAFQLNLKRRKKSATSHIDKNT